MPFQNIFRHILLNNIRNFSSKLKPKIEVNEQIISNIENNVFKPRLHPGIYKPRTINLPSAFIAAVEKALEDYPVKQLLDDSVSLVNYLSARHPPIEQNEFKAKKTEIEKRIFSQHITDGLSEEQVDSLKHKLKNKVERNLKTKLYHWKPIKYDIHTCLQYVLSRSAAEYAVLVRIFQEIDRRDPYFKPRSFFDFGSGVGIGTWAARHFWQKYIFEYFNVDASVDMNDLALIILKGGTGVKEPNIKGVFHRQFLPATNTTYDFVLSAYTLLELPSSQSRLETILKLWNKTQQYLVIVEQGTNAGFRIVNEARDFILNIKSEHSRGFVFSPCPHDEICPRFTTDTTPCNFEISYMTIPIGQNTELHKEHYCYVVLQKGKRNNENLEPWPRIVRPPLVRSKHTVCRMCTVEGNLEEIVLTASKHGQIAYRCAKACKWGDILPVKIKKSKD